MPGPLRQEISDRVKNFYASSKGKTKLVGLSGSKLYQRYLQVYGHEVSRGKFFQILKEVDDNGPSEPFRMEEWLPWQDDECSPQDIAYLLRMDAISLAFEGRHLLKHEAKWAKRLRVALDVDPLAIFNQFRFVAQYALREIAAHYLNSAVFTADLDSLLAYRPWIPECQRAYELSVAADLSPDPFSTPLEAQFPLEEAISVTPVQEPFPSVAERPEGWSAILLDSYGPFPSWYDLQNTGLNFLLPSSFQNSSPERVQSLTEVLRFWADG